METAFKYCFNRPKGMWNILWVLVPIFGWFALGGYGVRLIQEFSKGKFKKLPVLKFNSDMKLGFFMFLKALPFLIVYMIFIGLLNLIDPWFNLLRIITDLFMIPLLSIHFMNKETVESLFDFKILKAVYENLGDYLITILKSIALGIVFLIMWIILVGIPAGSFTKNIFLADFYRRRVK